jgi:hypothetical protein
MGQEKLKAVEKRRRKNIGVSFVIRISRMVRAFIKLKTREKMWEVSLRHMNGNLLAILEES